MKLDTRFTITQIYPNNGEKWECFGEEILDQVKLYPLLNGSIPQFIREAPGFYIEVIDENGEPLKRSFKIESLTEELIILKDESYYKTKGESQMYDVIKFVNELKNKDIESLQLLLGKLKNEIANLWESNPQEARLKSAFASKVEQELRKRK